MKKNDRLTKSQLRRKNVQLGETRVPIPRPGGPMKDKKKYNRKRGTLSEEQRGIHERTSCRCPKCLDEHIDNAHDNWDWDNHGHEGPI